MRARACSTGRRARRPRRASAGWCRRATRPQRSGRRGLLRRRGKRRGGGTESAPDDAALKHRFRTLSRCSLPNPYGTTAFLNNGLLAVRSHERIAVVARRDEGLLDRPGGDPADQIPHRAGLVVRARRARAAEGLLADHRPGWLVVDVEVSGRVLELVLGQLDRRAVAREDGSGEPVRRGAVDQLERLLILALGVHVGG